MDSDSEDPRLAEFGSLEAIFPELQRLDRPGAVAFSIEVPVNPLKPVTVTFPATATDATPLVPAIGPGPAAVGPNDNPTDSHEVAYLPSIVLHLALPEGYPTEKPPDVEIHTTPDWVPADVVKRLEDDGPRLWNDMGRDMVVFTYIDHIQQAAEGVFGMVDAEGKLKVDPAHKIAVLDYDIKAKQAAFVKETFDCGVCLDPKKGSVCHKMVDCGHVFCIPCLQDFYGNAIQEGDLASVRCLTPNCAKERTARPVSPGKRYRRPKTFIGPSELLQIGLSEDVVKRYVTLKYKTELESDKNTIYCPRSWCTGAARSKKHKPPEGLELGEASDDDSEDDSEDEGPPEKDKDEEGKASTQRFDPSELLAICEGCGFAFCSRCLQSWHGEFVRCLDHRNREFISEEDKASLEYLHLHTTPCPTCAAPAQKTHGCNHMVCFRCASHFCYLCSAWLDPANPYQHFNRQPDGKVTSCYMRLWELQAGDGADVGLEFEGGIAGPAHEVREPGQEPVAGLQGGDVGDGDGGGDGDDDDDNDDEEEDDEDPRVGRLNEWLRRNRGPGAGQVQRLPVVNIVPEIEEPDDGDDSDGDEGEADRGNGGQVGVAREGPLVLRIAAEPPQPPRRPVPPVVPAAPMPPPAYREQGGGAHGAGRGRGAGRRRGRGGGHGRAGQGHVNGQANGPAAVGANRGAQPRRGGRRGQQAAPPAMAADRRVVGDGWQEGDLDPMQAAWVRQFVLMALNDEEDGDDDD